jgi:hypothetical protein
MRYRGRKGIPTFNVMASCDFDMCFTFISVGWEGSAHDTRVFLHAINTPTLNFPKPPQGVVILLFLMLIFCLEIKYNFFSFFF